MRRKLIFVQLPAGSFLFDKNWGNIPLAAGYLKAYAGERGLSDSFAMEILSARDANLSTDATLISLLVSRAPDILAFSLYCFNTARSLYIISEVRKKLPGVMVIVGGPDVARDNDCVISHPSIDIGCFGEGEECFAELLTEIASGRPRFERVHGIFYSRRGARVFTPERISFVDVSCLLSPYLSGDIDPREYGKALLETVRGCCFRCSYCKVGEGVMRPYPLEKIRKELEYFKRLGIRDVVIIDSSFVSTGIFRPVAEKIIALNADKQLRFSAFNYAEHLDAERISLLQQCNFHTLGVGLQSSNTQTLKNINRHLNRARFIEGIRLLKKSGITFFVDIILGLPGDTVASFKRTLSFLKKNGIEKINYAHLLVLPGSRLRADAPRYGMKYLAVPPYQLIEGAYLRKDEIQTVMKAKYETDLLAFKGSLSSMIQCGYPARAGDAGRTLPAATRVNKVVVEIDATVQSERQIRAFADTIWPRLVQPATLWVTVGNLSRDAVLVKALTGVLFKKNPFLILNMIIELRGPFQRRELMGLKKEITSRENAGIGWMADAVSLCAVVPAGLLRENGALWFRGMRREVPFYFSLDLSPDNDGLNAMPAIAREKDSNGVLVGFSPRSTIPFIKRSQNMLMKWGARMGKEIHFRNIALVYTAGTVVYRSVRYEMKPDEHLVESCISFNRDFEAVSSLTPDRETMMELLLWQKITGDRGTAAGLNFPVPFHYPNTRV